MPQIEFKNVSKRYNEHTVALDDASFVIEPGEFVFVIGPSGAGKSTIVKLLIKEESPDSGEIYFNDREINSVEKDEISDLRRKIGVVFQDFKLLNSKTIHENVAVALEVVDSKDSEIKSIVPNVLSLVNLADKVKNYPVHLSGGEKQRASIARAIAHEPDVLVADEPTGMIDPKSADEVVEVLEKINSLGTTIVMATHDEAIVNKLKKRVIRIKDGIVVSDKKGGKYDA
jgi:cell division transport system ATP-binding protein